MSIRRGLILLIIIVKLYGIKEIVTKSDILNTFNITEPLCYMIVIVPDITKVLYKILQKIELNILNLLLGMKTVD